MLWHFRNAKHISICLAQRCHYSSIWYFRIGIFQSKSIQQTLDFPHNWKTPFKKSLPTIPGRNELATIGHVSREWPMSGCRGRGRGGTCHTPIPGLFHCVAAVAPSSTITVDNITPSQVLTSHPSWRAPDLLRWTRGSLQAGRGRDVHHLLHFRTIISQNREHSLAMRLPKWVPIVSTGDSVVQRPGNHSGVLLRTQHYQPWLFSDATMLPSLPLQADGHCCLLPTHAKGEGQGRAPPCLAMLIPLPETWVERQSKATTQQSIELCGKGGVPCIKFSDTAEKWRNNKKALPSVKLGKQRSWKFIHFSHPATVSLEGRTLLTDWPVPSLPSPGGSTKEEAHDFTYAC